jgi:hypothetical protein
MIALPISGREYIAPHQIETRPFRRFMPVMDFTTLALIRLRTVFVLSPVCRAPWARSLRVTLVYRRDGHCTGGDWRLAHRHADPVVAGITLEQAAALAR